MGGLANGLYNLFKQGGKRIGNAIDNFWLDAEARKAISDEVRNKFKPFIENAHAGESKRATNITELDKKLAQSKQDLQDAQKSWQDKYDNALADAKSQRQTDISDYDAELKRYQDALDNAKAGRQGILDQLYDQEAKVDQPRTLFIDVNTGDRYIFNPSNGKYDKLDIYYQRLNPKAQQKLNSKIQNYETRLFDPKSGNKIINAFDNYGKNGYSGNNAFDNYLQIREGQNSALIRNLKDADNQIKQAKAELNAWKSNGRPADWDDTPNSQDLAQFESNFTGKNGKLPSEYSFNGQTYSKESDLIDAYNKALKHEKALQASSRKNALNYTSQQNQEIAKRIQDAKDIKKAKLALGAGVGAGALAAGAAAMYGGDDTDNTDNIDNTDNTDNTYTGEPDPDLNIENTPEGKAALIGKSLVDTDFDPDKADALARAAYDQGVEDSNSLRSSDIVTADGQSIDDGLFELLKAMKDPYKADAIANYIYSRHGDDPEVQRLGWRGWLNRYGDSLRSKMNIDPSSYKGMHISGGL